MSSRLLVFGSTGQVASELRRADWGADLAPTFLDRAAADLSQPERLAAVVRAERPDLVIIAAAYTAVDRAETEQELVWAVNAEAPGVIAAAAAEHGAPVVHLSTDYVFDGGKSGAYVETDPTAPMSAYGASKCAGEQAVRRANPKHLILRTSWVYSSSGSNFLRTMIRLAATRTEVQVVDDQIGCPTAARDLAGAIAQLSPRLLDTGASWGTYHLAGKAATTWHGFAEAIFLELASRGGRRPDNIGIPTSAYPTPARRPRNSRLSSAGFHAAFGFDLPGFQDVMPAILGEALAIA